MANKKLVAGYKNVVKQMNLRWCSNTCLVLFLMSDDDCISRAIEINFCVHFKIHNFVKMFSHKSA